MPRKPCEVVCLNCGATQQQPSGRKFCSQSCAAKFNNRARGRSCATGCGRPLRSQNAENRFCSRRCAQEQAYKTYVDRWLRGLESGVTRNGDSVSTYIRRYIAERDGKACRRCGWCEVHPVTGNVPVHLEHIDGDCTNNRPENLCWLCPNCHSLTPTFGSLNIGRSKRSKRLVVKRSP